MSKYKIIVNPTSGRGLGEESVPHIKRLLGGHNLDFDIARTERPWHAAELAQEAAATGYDVVVAVGGDGTANKVINGLMQAIIQPSLMISIMNGQRMGCGFFMAPEDKPDDGLFDLCLVHGVSRASIFALIPHFLRGTQATQEPVRMEQAQKAIITTVEGVLPAHADGETLCTQGQRLEIELLPSQIDVVCLPPGGVE